ncbi:MAG: TonB-dependent receptor [Gemmatimonadales bacterium]
MFLRNVRVRGLALFAFAAIGATSAAAQSTGTVRGTVTRTGDNEALAGVQVTVRGVGVATVTNANGKYVLQRVPAGAQTIVFRWLGYAPVEKNITIAGESTVDAALEPKPVSLADLTVSAVSREPERSVEAPAASTSIEPRVLQNTGATGQVPLALAQAPGVDLVQSGVNDFNINARGFNSSLNRRVLTLLDGRDLAIAFLGSQEWSSIPTSTEDLRGMELVRGPGSALYGANAFAGVINMTTLSPREAEGAKITVSGGELGSFKVDGRAAKTFGEGRWGFRLGGGYGQSDSWSRSRTQVDSVGAGGAFTFSMRNEYKDAVKAADDFVVKAAGVEALPLHGQTLAAGTRAPLGDPDPLKSAYGTARLDRYFTSGSVITLEGGASQSENETLVTGIGRVQVRKGFKPYARAAYNSEHLNVFAYANRRTSKDTTAQYSLASGAQLIERATISHVEAQGNAAFLTNGKAIVGASFRQYNVNTDGTLMRPVDDDRHDKVYSAYTQLEYKLSPKLRLVGAARYDKGDLFEGQFSPKAALVFSPSPNHSFRATFNRAFQTPNYSEFFLSAAAGAPANFSNLEAGLRASALGPALAGVPVGTLFTTSAAVPVRARGNADLTVEKTNGYELGYKGSLTPKLYVTVDAYQNNIKDFVTDLLPGVNPTFGAWTSPAAVPAQFRAALEGAVKSNLIAAGQTLAAAGLTRQEDGGTAIVVSYTNAGKVDQKGIDVGLGYQLSNEFRIDGSYSWFDFKVKEASAAGDQLLPNTPKTKGTVTLGYEGARNGFDASISGRFVASYDWAAGVFAGKVPSSESFSANAGWQMTQRYRVFVVGTNIFDQQRYQLYGGAVIGRRVLAGLTAAF